MNAAPLVIYGNGAMARLLYSFVRRERSVAAFVVDGECIAEGETTFCGCPLVPLADVATRFVPTTHEAIVAVGYADMNRLRQSRAKALKTLGYSLASYVHPSVVIHDDVAIGEGCIVYDHVALHPGCVVGEGVFIASNVSLGHDCQVGDWSFINSGAALAGKATLGAGCFLGVNATVADNLTLGARCYVGANTLVARDAADDSVLISPAGERFPTTSGTFLRLLGGASKRSAP